jgi:hypothetical protein
MSQAQHEIVSGPSDESLQAFEPTAPLLRGHRRYNSSADKSMRQSTPGVQQWATPSFLPTPESQQHSESHFSPVQQSPLVDCEPHVTIGEQHSSATHLPSIEQTSPCPQHVPSQQLSEQQWSFDRHNWSALPHG